MLVRSFVPDGVRGVIVKHDSVRVARVREGVAVITLNGGRWIHGRTGDHIDAVLTDGTIVQVRIDTVRADRVRLGFSVFDKRGNELTGNAAIRSLPVVPESF